MNPLPTISTADSRRSTSFPGTRSALVLLLLINLFNNIDRWLLAAVVKPIKQTFFGEAGLAHQEGSLVAVMNWFQQRLGFKPEDALMGLLGTAFMVVYNALLLGRPLPDPRHRVHSKAAKRDHRLKHEWMPRLSCRAKLQAKG